MIGEIFAAEWRVQSDPDTGREVTQLTAAPAHSYPLYYFLPATTADGRYLVFHSERSGEVQLYRLDLASGEIGQLTDGHTHEAGWAIWCEWHLDGIYNHLSALNRATGEVLYFQDEEIRATTVDTFANRIVARLGAGRMPIGQSAVSADGSFFAYIHTDRAAYLDRLRVREAETGGDLHGQRTDFETFREGVHTALALVDTRTGAEHLVIETEFHFHHVLFLDERTLLLNHPRGCHGIWAVDTDGTNLRHLRPAEAPGAHGAEIVHAVVTDRGIAYEAVARAAGTRANYLGLYDPASGRFAETRLPLEGYVHVGRDPAGQLWFVECDGPRHELLLVEHATGTTDGQARLSLLRTLGSPAPQQRRHAHPFLSDDHRHLFFTDRGENGFSQIFRMDVADLTAP